MTTRKNLLEILLADTRRAQVDAEFVALIRDFIAERRGLKGMAYRTGLSMLEKARPGIVERGVNKLLPIYMAALEPLYAEFQKAGTKDFATFLTNHSKRAAAALVMVADTRIRNASSTAQKFYDRFRADAESEVQNLLPGLGTLIQRHLATSKH